MKSGLMELNVSPTLERISLVIIPSAYPMLPFDKAEAFIDDMKLILFALTSGWEVMVLMLFGIVTVFVCSAKSSCREVECSMMFFSMSVDSVSVSLFCCFAVLSGFWKASGWWLSATTLSSVGSVYGSVDVPFIRGLREAGVEVYDGVLSIEG